MQIDKRQLGYWAALAHTPYLTTADKNTILAALFKRQRTVVDFMDSGRDSWLALASEIEHDGKKLNLTDKKLASLEKAVAQLPNYAFLVEDLLNQGYQLIPIMDDAYSPTLKHNLKFGSPILLYARGDVSLMQAPSVAMVGARNATEVSLQFTTQVSARLASEGNVVVSGFAQGVDQASLVSALEVKGNAIIVLPQGIATFGSGFKKYYKPITQGRLLVLSEFHPQLPWSTGAAMARNKTIYGLAQAIYVAQSGASGGTWNGATDGIKKKMNVLVRQPNPGEDNANAELIKLGATPVDSAGNVIPQEPQQPVVERPKRNKKPVQLSLFPDEDV